MHKIRCLTSFTLFLPLLLSLSLQVQAVESPEVGSQEQASNMFVFQHKLADKGNDKAQYKIAVMYETGDGIGQNKIKAKEWYQQAALKNNVDAKNRLVYLEVMESGFIPEINNAWLGGVRSEAYANQPEALFLMAQIYQFGLGVEKDLDKALELMYRLGAEGNVVADQQIPVIEKEQLTIIKNKRKKAKAQLALKKKKEAVWQKDVVATAVVASTKNVPIIQDKSEIVGKQSTIVDDEMAKKRARYEAVMRQLAAEQAEIDRLQESVEGDKLASVDDEF